MTIEEVLRQQPLDPNVYNLNENELAFFKAQTGIHDETALREHILQVQAEAFAIYPYPCIRRLAFTTMKISTYPAYEKILKLGQERPGAIFLDLGCCFGNDARKVIADGYPLENVIASDLRPEFWELGHKLFRSSSETFPVIFIPGNIFDPDFLSPTAPPATQEPNPAPLLPMLTSLTPLQHHISVIHASAFFHIFPLSQQTILAHLLASLLSPISGSMILGSHIGEVEEDKIDPKGTLLEKGLHSPASWEKMWTGEDGVFKPEEVLLWTTAHKVERKGGSQLGRGILLKAYMLVWSVTRA